MDMGVIGEQIENLKLETLIDEDEGIVHFQGKGQEGEIESSDMIQFNPPVYLQRYAAVRDVISNFLLDPLHKDLVNGNTVLEVGCAEYGMLKFLKGIIELGKIIFMDLDEQLLVEKKHFLRPLPAEHLRKLSRPKPMVVESYAGCITKVDSKLLQQNPKVWAVVAIELIEHLYPDVLRGFEISVFGVISPPLVIVTTPNSDFNPIFNLTPGKFRHWDHKFEWSRQEFILWCQKICTEFPDYQFIASGICPGPLPDSEAEHFGCVSQMAVFQKKIQKKDLHQDIVGKSNVYPGVVQDNAYKLIESIVYPNYVETRSVERIILDELDYTIRNYWLNRRNIECYIENGRTELFFPLKNLQRTCNGIPHLNKNIEYLKDVISAANYEVILNEEEEYTIRLQVPSLYDYDDNVKDQDEDLMDDENMDDAQIEDSGTSCNSTFEEESWE